MTQESGLQVTVTKSLSAPGVVVVKAEGELDEDGAEKLIAAVTRQTKMGRRQFVLDFAAAGPMSVQALLDLATAFSRLQGKGCRFAIAGARGDAFDAIEASGLRRIAPCYPDLTSAARAL
jgi:anti-anti-sigma factor